MIRLLRALLKTLDPPTDLSVTEQNAGCGSGSCGCKPPAFPTPALIASGWDKLNNKQFTQAIADFDEAIKEDRHDPRPYYGRGLAKAALGEHAEAIIDFDESHRRNTKQPDVLSSRGYSHLQLGNLDAALADFTKAARLEPNDAYSLISRAACLMDLGSLDQADEDLREAMHLIDFQDDESLEDEFRDAAELPVIDEVDTTELAQWRGESRGYALCVRGQLRSRQGRFADSLSDLGNACELNSDDHWSASALAWMLATCPDDRFRNGSEALALAERVVSHREDSGNLSILAAALAEVGRFQDAIQAARKAMELAVGKRRTDLEEELAAYEASQPYRDPLMVSG